MAKFTLLAGGRISGVVERCERPATPNHDPTAGGGAAMAESDSTARLCVVCFAPVVTPASKPGRKPESCSEKCRVEASRRHKQQYHVVHRERDNARTRARCSVQKAAEDKRYYESNRTKIRAKQRELYQRIPIEERRALGRSQHAKRKEAANQRMRAYRLEPGQRERQRQREKNWQARNPNKVRAQGLIKRARKARAFVERVDPQVVFERDKRRCGICRKLIKVRDEWHIDHVVPLSKGGTHSYDNVQLAHAKCNLVKHDKLPNGQWNLFQKVG